MIKIFQPYIPLIFFCIVVIFGMKFRGLSKTDTKNTKLELHLKELPKDMIPSRDNVVYIDTETMELYIIKWGVDDTKDIPKRYYLPVKLQRLGKTK